MRFVLPLLALCALSSAPLRADMFNITLSGDLSGDGTFTTDGICSICLPGMGLLSLTINIGRNSGTDAFDITDDTDLDITIFDRSGNQLFYFRRNSETGDLLNVAITAWSLSLPGGGFDQGSYSITPSVPEPSSLFLLMPIAALFGLRWRHQRPMRDV